MFDTSSLFGPSGLLGDSDLASSGLTVMVCFVSLIFMRARWLTFTRAVIRAVFRWINPNSAAAGYGTATAKDTAGKWFRIIRPTAASMRLYDDAKDAQATDVEAIMKGSAGKGSRRPASGAKQQEVMLEYDYVIVGAGPGGLGAAHQLCQQLAQRGASNGAAASILLLESGPSVGSLDDSSVSPFTCPGVAYQLCQARKGVLSEVPTSGSPRPFAPFVPSPSPAAGGPATVRVASGLGGSSLGGGSSVDGSMSLSIPDDDTLNEVLPVRPVLDRIVSSPSKPSSAASLFSVFWPHAAPQTRLTETGQIDVPQLVALPKQRSPVSWAFTAAIRQAFAEWFVAKPAEGKDDAAVAKDATSAVSTSAPAPKKPVRVITPELALIGGGGRLENVERATLIAAGEDEENAIPELLQQGRASLWPSWLRIHSTSGRRTHLIHMPGFSRPAPVKGAPIDATDPVQLDIVVGAIVHPLQPTKPGPEPKDIKEVSWIYKLITPVQANVKAKYPLGRIAAAKATPPKVQFVEVATKVRKAVIVCAGALGSPSIIRRLISDVPLPSKPASSSVSADVVSAGPSAPKVHDAVAITLLYQCRPGVNADPPNVNGQIRALRYAMLRWWYGDDVDSVSWQSPVLLTGSDSRLEWSWNAPSVAAGATTGGAAQEGVAALTFQLAIECVPLGGVDPELLVTRNKSSSTSGIIHGPVDAEISSVLTVAGFHYSDVSRAAWELGHFKEALALRVTVFPPSVAPTTATSASAAAASSGSSFPSVSAFDAPLEAATKAALKHGVDVARWIAAQVPLCHLTTGKEAIDTDILFALARDASPPADDGAVSSVATATGADGEGANEAQQGDAAATTVPSSEDVFLTLLKYFKSSSQLRRFLYGKLQKKESQQSAKQRSLLSEAREAIHACALSPLYIDAYVRQYARFAGVFCGSCKQQGTAAVAWLADPATSMKAAGPYRNVFIGDASAVGRVDGSRPRNLREAGTTATAWVAGSLAALEACQV